MKENDIDKIKAKLRLNEIDEAQRKELFKKFTDAGGKVISEREKRRSLMIDREKQKEHQRRLDEHHKAKSQHKGAIELNEKKANLSPIKKTTPRLQEDPPFNKFIIRMKLRLMRVTGFNTLFFHKSFLKKLSGPYKTSLMELQMAYLALFKKDPSLGNRIIGRLDKISPLYYALIDIAGDIFDPMLFDEITENFIISPESPHGVSEIREPLTRLFRPLFILKPYENTLLNAFEKSIDYYGEIANTRELKTIKKKDLRNSLFIIFDDLFPKLHTLFCHYHGVLFLENDRKIEELLEIIPAEKPDARKKGYSSNYERSSLSTSIEDIYSKEEITQESSQESEEDKNLKEGLKLMYKLDFNTLRSLYDKKNRFELIQENDKTLLTYLLFLEFESEYSIILTTNQIKFNIDFDSHGKSNYKEKLQNLFERMRKCHEAFMTYYDAYGSYIKIKSSRPISNEQYITYTKRVDEVTKRKNELGLMCRNVIQSFMENVQSVLSELVEDMNTNQRFINNPQDIIEIYEQIEGDKKLKNKKIYEAIQIAYKYAMALSYRLSPGGDLTGSGEFSEEKSVEEKKSPENESILKELDDII